MPCWKRKSQGSDPQSVFRLTLPESSCPELNSFILMLMRYLGSDTIDAPVEVVHIG
jgi:hypothetical protein